MHFNFPYLFFSLNSNYFSRVVISEIRSTVKKYFNKKNRIDTPKYPYPMNYLLQDLLYRELQLHDLAEDCSNVLKYRKKQRFCGSSNYLTIYLAAAVISSERFYLTHQNGCVWIFSKNLLKIQGNFMSRRSCK